MGRERSVGAVRCGALNDIAAGCGCGCAVAVLCCGLNYSANRRGREYQQSSHTFGPFIYYQFYVERLCSLY